MGVELTLYDSNPWLEDVFSLPVDKAGICFFSHLGYCEKDMPVKLHACPSKTFVFSLLSKNRILNDLDVVHTTSIRTGSYLFSLDAADYSHGSDAVAFYAISMEDVGYARSDEAYAIHRIFSKFDSRWSVVLFRHLDSLMLSFLKPEQNDGYAIYLSDWLSLSDSDHGQLARIHVANTSLDSPVDCFDGLMFESIRPYYKYPIIRSSAVYSILDTLDVSTKIDLPLIPREELDSAADKVMSVYVDMYGDDYIEDKTLGYDDDDDFDIDDVEWELENSDLDESEVPDDRQLKLPLSFDSSPDSRSAIRDIPDEVMASPIALLKWMESHPDSEAQTSSSSSRQKRLRIVPIGSRQPKTGSYVRHISMGKGVVTWADASHVKIDFGGTQRVFPFPGAFDSGCLVLLG